MNYTKTRRRPDRGREWLSDDGNYKIVRVWVYRKPTKGKRQKKYREAFYGMVRGYRFDGKKFWDFSAERDIYNTREQAELANERNKAWWTRFVELDKESGSRTKRLAALVAEGRFIYQNLPFWAKKQCKSDLLRTHMPSLFEPHYTNPLTAPINEPVDDECEPTPNPSELTSPSETTANPSTDPTANSPATTTSGPASNAVAAAEPPSGKASSTRAETARARVKGRKKKSKPRTKKSLTPTPEPVQSGKKTRKSSKPSTAG